MRLRLVAFLLAVAASVLLAKVPFYHGKMTETDAGRPTRTIERSWRFVEINGPQGALMLVLAPLALGVPLVARRARIPVAGVMLLFVLASAATVGLFYLPSVMLLLWPEKSPARSEMVETPSPRWRI
jgi:hypothetical protein